jgi:hypothetical protein
MLHMDGCTPAEERGRTATISLAFIKTSGNLIKGALINERIQAIMSTRVRGVL